MSVVVSDTSPLRALNHLGEVRLLETLYGSVLVPPAVACELAFPRGRAGLVDVKALPFVSIQIPSDLACVQKYAATLDRGEAEAIALAIQVGAEAMLIDELAGRAAAAAAGLQCVGVLGILQRAKRQSLIPEIRSRLDRLRDEIQFYISDQLYQQVLQSAGEARP